MYKKTLVVVLLGFFLIFALALRPPADPDLGWHLKTGEIIWKFGLPTNDPYSFSLSPDFYWVNKEWGIEALMYGILKLFGVFGLEFFFAFIVAFCFGYLAGEICMTKPSWNLRIAIGLLSVIASFTFVGIRPQMIGLLYLSLLLIVVKKLYVSKETTAAWSIPFIMLLWVNTHGSFILGYGILAVVLVMEKVKARRIQLLGEDEWFQVQRTMSNHAWNQLAKFSSIGLLMIFVNPYTYQILSDLAINLTEGNTLTYIQEWMSPDFQSLEGWTLLFVIFLFIDILYLARRRIDPTQLMLILSGLFLALLSRRHIPILMILLAPVLLEYVPDAFRNLTVMKPKYQAVSVAVLIIASLSIPVLAANSLNEPLPFMKSKSIDYLMSNIGNDTLFNSYGWGGAIISNSNCTDIDHIVSCSPKVFIDGRMSYWKSKHNTMILGEYIDVVSVQDNWNETLSKYNITWVYLDKGRDRLLVQVLMLHPEWEIKYQDETMFIAEKRHNN